MTAGQRRESRTAIPHVSRETAPHLFESYGPRLRAPDKSECRELVTCYASHGVPIDFHPTIQPPHRLFVESSTQERKRRNGGRRTLLQLARHESGSLIWWEEMPIIYECNEIVFGQQAIRRISIDHIYGA